MASCCVVLGSLSVCLFDVQHSAVQSLSEEYSAGERTLLSHREHHSTTREDGVADDAVAADDDAADSVAMHRSDSTAATVRVCHQTAAHIARSMHSAWYNVMLCV